MKVKHIILAFLGVFILTYVVGFFKGMILPVEIMLLIALETSGFLLILILIFYLLSKVWDKKIL